MSRDASGIDRREFLGAMMVSGGIAASLTMPWTLPASAGEPTRVHLSDWTIDDMWGAYPRYAERIDYAGYRPERAQTAASAEPLDILFNA